jgi:hypothetical protein
MDKLRHKSLGMHFTKRVITASKRDYESCLAGKMKELYERKTDVRETIKGRKLHCDISGIRHRSIRGYHYYLLLIDDATRTTWVRLLKDKSTATILLILTKLLDVIQNETTIQAIAVRANIGRGEFGQAFQNHLKSRGTQFEPYPPFKHSMNGVSERAMYTIDCKARSMVHQAGLPPEF